VQVGEHEIVVGPGQQSDGFVTAGSDVDGITLFLENRGSGDAQTLFVVHDHQASVIQHGHSRRVFLRAVIS
jgi:hypothetical protein